MRHLPDDDESLSRANHSSDSHPHFSVGCIYTWISRNTIRRNEFTTDHGVLSDDSEPVHTFVARVCRNRLSQSNIRVRVGRNEPVARLRTGDCPTQVVSCIVTADTVSQEPELFGGCGRSRSLVLPVTQEVLSLVWIRTSEQPLEPNDVFLGPDHPRRGHVLDIHDSGARQHPTGVPRIRRARLQAMRDTPPPTLERRRDVHRTPPPHRPSTRRDPIVGVVVVRVDHAPRGV